MTKQVICVTRKKLRFRRTDAPTVEISQKRNEKKFTSLVVLGTRHADHVAEPFAQVRGHLLFEHAEHVQELLQLRRLLAGFDLEEVRRLRERVQVARLVLERHPQQSLVQLERVAVRYHVPAVQPVHVERSVQLFDAVCSEHGKKQKKNKRNYNTAYGPRFAGPSRRFSRTSESAVHQSSDVAHPVRLAELPVSTPKPVARASGNVRTRDRPEMTFALVSRTTRYAAGTDNAAIDVRRTDFQLSADNDNRPVATGLTRSGRGGGKRTRRARCGSEIGLRTTVGRAFAACRKSRGLFFLSYRIRGGGVCGGKKRCPISAKGLIDDLIREEKNVRIARGGDPSTVGRGV